MALTHLETAEQANPGIWLETRTKIRGVTGRVGSMVMNVVQRRAGELHNSCKRRKRPVRGIGAKPRKRGFSTKIAALHYTELQKGPIEGVIIGNKLETSDRVFQMIECFAKHDEHVQRGLWGSVPKCGAVVANFPHGSELKQSSALGEGIRSQTPQFCHLTEAAHFENQKETFTAALNAIPDVPESSIWIESTPNGMEEFEKKWANARWPTAEECPGGVEYWRQWEVDCPQSPDDGDDPYQFVRVFAAWFEFENARLPLTAEEKDRIRRSIDSKSWYEGERDLIERYGNVRASDGAQRLGNEVEYCDMWEQLAWRRSIIKNKCGLDPRIFDAEYPRDPKSMFLSSGRTFFDADAIAHYQKRAREQVWEYGQIDVAAGIRAVWRGCESDLAVFMRCEQPRVGCYYLLSCDSAEGEDQTSGDDPDRHAVLVLRRAYLGNDGVFWPERMVARVKAPSRVPLEVLAELIDLLSRFWGRCPAIIEMNNTGLAVLKLCAGLGVPLWKRIDVNPRSGKKEEKLGWRTTDTADYGGLRSLILSELRKACTGVANAEGGVDYALDICEENLVYELSMFGEKDGKLVGLGAHDDDVLSLAMNHFNINAATAYEEPPIVRVPPPELRRLYEQQGSEVGLAMRS